MNNTSQHQRAPDCLPPHIDVTQSAVAYGIGAVPKIVRGDHAALLILQSRELKDGDVLTKQRALSSLSDLVRNPDNVKHAVDNGVSLPMCDLTRRRPGVAKGTAQPRRPNNPPQSRRGLPPYLGCVGRVSCDAQATPLVARP